MAYAHDLISNNTTSNSSFYRIYNFIIISFNRNIHFEKGSFIKIEGSF